MLPLSCSPAHLSLLEKLEQGPLSSCKCTWSVCVCVCILGVWERLSSEMGSLCMLLDGHPIRKSVISVLSHFSCV